MRRQLISIYKSFGKGYVTQFLLDVNICIGRLAYHANQELVISKTSNPELLTAGVSIFFVFVRTK
jgi:hypothetical protein